MAKGNAKCVQLLICPVCEAPLDRVNNTLKCPQAHSFDVAREGYVNLLLAGRKRPKVLGDTRDMLRARRSFLERGSYSPLSDAINERVRDHLANLTPGDTSRPACIADVGWALGVAFSYRWKDGLGLGFGYEFWLLSANGVYETTVTQSFLGNLQYSFLADRATHPLIRLRGGLLLLGPSFRVATIGGTAEIGAGAEVEIASDATFSFLVTGNLKENIQIILRLVML